MAPPWSGGLGKRRPPPRLLDGEDFRLDRTETAVPRAPSTVFDVLDPDGARGGGGARRACLSLLLCSWDFFLVRGESAF